MKQSKKIRYTPAELSPDLHPKPVGPELVTNSSMASQSNPRQKSALAFLASGQAVAFDPTEFAFTLHFASEMARKPGLLNCQEEHVDFVEESGEVTRYTFPDNPENRFISAVLQRYRGEMPKYFGFLFRWFALMDLVRDGKLAGYCHEREDDNGLPDAVIEVAASLPLSSTGKFPASAFRKALRKRLSHAPGLPEKGKTSPPRS